MVEKTKIDLTVQWLKKRWAQRHLLGHLLCMLHKRHKTNLVWEPNDPEHLRLICERCKKQLRNYRMNPTQQQYFKGITRVY